MQDRSSPRSPAGAQAAPAGPHAAETGAYTRPITLTSTTHRTWTCTPSASAGRRSVHTSSVSSDLKHNLAFQVPVILFHTANELEQSVQAGSVGAASRRFIGRAFSRPHLPRDGPSGRSVVRAHHTRGRRTSSDSTSSLARRHRGGSRKAWRSTNAASGIRAIWSALRDAVRANAIPKMSALSGSGGSTDPRLVYGLGHAAFDFIESRWGKPGVRQFIFGLRQTAINGSDPYESGLRIRRDEFDRAFEQYLRERFAGPAGQIPARGSTLGATVRIEGDSHRDQFPRADRARLHRAVGSGRGRDQTTMGRGVWRQDRRMSCGH